MCEMERPERTSANTAGAAAYDLADMASRHFDKPISREKLQAFILGNWDEIARLAHAIHRGERRKGARDRRA